MTFFGFSGGPAIPGLIDYNFIKFRDAVGKVFAVRNKIMQQEIGKGSYLNFKNQKGRNQGMIDSIKLSVSILVSRVNVLIFSSSVYLLIF